MHSEKDENSLHLSVTYLFMQNFCRMCIYIFVFYFIELMILQIPEMGTE